MTRPARRVRRGEDNGPVTTSWPRPVGTGSQPLRGAYDRCRRINAEHGRTYYLSTLLLPADRRPHVHALYAFARYADDLVDSLERPDPAGLVRWSEQALSALAGRADPPDDVVAATAHTVRVLGLDVRLFEDFLSSMQRDIDVHGYQTYDELRQYMWGSAAVIGLMMLPVLGPVRAGADAAAIALGEAFQLTNFIRDVGEDLRRGRIYLPAEDLARFGVTRADLAAGVITDGVRDLLRFEIARARSHYRVAAEGVSLVEPVSRPCLRTAITLYGEILDQVERSDYQVLTRRVAVPRLRRARVALPGLTRAVAARYDRSRWHGATGPGGASTAS